jgi:hypothetical protein
MVSTKSETVQPPKKLRYNLKEEGKDRGRTSGPMEKRTRQ